VLADIPGLIEGAHEGSGLGDRFLGHVERTRVLLHLIDGTQEDVAEAYTIIRGELEAYGNGLDEKQEIIGLNKCDSLDDEEIAEKKAILEELADAPVMVLSGATGIGVQPVLFELLRRIKEAKAEEAEDSAPGRRHPVPVHLGERTMAKPGEELQLGQDHLDQDHPDDDENDEGDDAR
jgi:GTP-binding protein